MLFTEFVTIGTAGASVDGREIKEQWLRDAAEQYDPEIYTAVINGEHEKWYGALGTVHKLRLGKSKQGKLILQAQLRPNARLIQFNMAGQKLFTSMEIEPKFSDTGKAYLEGLAVTDEPASLGTTMLQLFNTSKSGKVLTEPHEFSLGMDGEEPMPVINEERLFKRIVNAITGSNKNEFKIEPKNQEETEMSPEQFAAIEQHFKIQGDAMTAITTTMGTMAEHFKKVTHDDVEPIEPEETEIQKLSKTVESLSATVLEFSKENPPKFSGQNPGDGETKEIFA